MQLDISAWQHRPAAAKPERRPSDRGPKDTLGKRGLSKRDLLDSRLALAARDGDHSAYAAIFHRHKDWIYRYLESHLLDEEDAHDVMQEIFVSVWRYLRRYDAKRSFKTWLSRIVLNKTRDRVRRTVAQHALRKSLRGLQLVSCVSENRLEALLIRAEAANRIEKALEALQPQYRQALALTVVENFSDSDAAAKLGIKRKVLENRVLRAKERLATLLRASDLRDLVCGSDTATF